MILSKTTTYAIRILIHMATGDQKVYSAQDLYDHLRISNRYLRRLLTQLTRHGFIVSTRGRNGGFAFSRDTRSIFISEIIEAFEGPLFFRTCILGMTDCKVSPSCILHKTWEGIKNKMTEEFSTKSLFDIDAAYMN